MFDSRENNTWDDITDEWINLHPNSSIGKILKAVCHSWKNGVRVSY